MHIPLCNTASITLEFYFSLCTLPFSRLHLYSTLQHCKSITLQFYYALCKTANSGVPLCNNAIIPHCKTTSSTLQHCKHHFPVLLFTLHFARLYIYIPLCNNAKPSLCSSTLHVVFLILKGIVHQFCFRCSNLIFWIVMGCGIADFGRRGL